MSAAANKGGSQPSATEKKEFHKTIATNRRARHDYHVEDTVEAGLALHGSEVKSLRTQQVDFADSYARVDNGECWLFGLQISTYRKSHVQLPDPVRRRRLLLKKREIEKLRQETDMAGRTLIPLEIYFRGSWAKVRLGICKGKTKADKRHTLREKEVRREIDRTMKDRRR